MPIERSFDDAIVGFSPTMEDLFITAACKFGEGKQFESLWQDLELSDVTLVCNDGSQVMAQKTVLALSSPFLRDILTKSKRLVLGTTRTALTTEYIMFVTIAATSFLRTAL